MDGVLILKNYGGLQGLGIVKRRKWVDVGNGGALGVTWGLSCKILIDKIYY